VAIFSQTWKEWQTGSRLGLIAGAGGVLLLTAALGFWALHQDYRALFVDLAAPDAAAMVAELDKMKVPYRLGEDGTSILVPRDLVHKTRIKMMGRELPLRGAVGFELFNTTDFGMTEFAQKVNYQRALQGELTRTIMAIEEVQFARVHLAIPEQGLFRKGAAKPKASISVGLKPGKKMRPEQVNGIQRLVSASVPDIRPQDVTVLDQRGVPLSPYAAADGEPDLSASRLDLKKATEDYFAGKVLEVLERTFGPGQAIASVDVALNLDQVRVTTEDVLPAKGREKNLAAAPTGVVVRERQIMREGGAGERTVGDKSYGSAAVLANTETEYQVGRRTEQVLTAPGSVRALSVAVVVRRTLSPAQIEQVREVVAMAVGYNRTRGDGIAVYSLEQFAGQAGATPLAPPGEAAEPAPPPAVPTGEAAVEPAGESRLWLIASGGVALLLAVLLLAGMRSARGKAGRQLTDAERAALLADVRAWTAAAEPKPVPAERG
jgi:flagellar M-ring protein FliF